MITIGKQRFILHPFKKEADLEASILEVENQLFGKNRIYVDPKKRIGKRSAKQNIPDGYLLDLSSSKEPVLYVVENELATHDPLRHIAVQILEFSLSFTATPHKAKTIIREAVADKPGALKIIDEYCKANDIENLDRLLDKMIYDAREPFRALVIIDEVPDDLAKILNSRFKFPVEILTLTRHISVSKEIAYVFEPFMADVTEVAGGSAATEAPSVDPSDLDTVVVPCKEDGFNEVFLGENRWYKIRMSPSMIPKLKYIAAYQSAPVSAITHVAEIESIELWPESTKYVVNFKGAAMKVPAKGLLKSGKVKAPQAPRYANFKKLKSAKNMDEAFL